MKTNYISYKRAKLNWKTRQYYGYFALYGIPVLFWLIGGVLPIHYRNLTSKIIICFAMLSTYWAFVSEHVHKFVKDTFLIPYDKNPEEMYFFTEEKKKILNNTIFLDEGESIEEYKEREKKETAIKETKQESVD